MSLLVENDVCQVILTPETKAEKEIAKLMREHETAKVEFGPFYHHPNTVGYWRQFDSENSVLLVMRNPKQSENIP